MVNKVTEGRPHIVDMIKNNEIALVINTVEERRNAIADSRQIRTSALLARVTTFTTIFGAEAAVEGMQYMDDLDVISVQEMHAQLALGLSGTSAPWNRQLVELDLADWAGADAERGVDRRARGRQGAVLSALGFELLPEEQALLTPALLSPGRAQHQPGCATARSRAWRATRRAQRAVGGDGRALPRAGAGS